MCIKHESNDLEIEHTPFSEIYGNIFAQFFLAKQLAVL